MAYTVKFQTESKYKSISYGSNSIYNSACGPASLCNALQALGLADVSIPTMCKLAVSCGARVNGGTVMATLLRETARKYHFTYSTTSKNAELLAHLNAGGVAILHNGSSYKLFSNSGHFVAAVAASGSTITVLDSYWYDGKYTASSIRRNYVSVVQKGVIKTSLTQCGKATIDRSPSYYLISREVITETPTETKKEDDEVVQNVKMKINGSVQNVKSIMKDGRNYVQLAQIGELLGLQIGYTDKTPTVDFAQLKIKVDGADHTVSGGAMVPGTSYAAVRELLELLGYEVGWDADTKAVTVKSGADTGSEVRNKEVG